MLQLNGGRRFPELARGWAVTGRSDWLFVRYPSGGFNPNLFPYENMEGKSIASKNMRHRHKVRNQLSRKNRDRCLVILRVMTKRWTANAQRKRFTRIMKLCG